MVQETTSAYEPVTIRNSIDFLLISFVSATRYKTTENCNINYNEKKGKTHDNRQWNKNKF